MDKFYKFSMVIWFAFLSGVCITKSLDNGFNLLGFLVGVAWLIISISVSTREYKKDL